MLHPELIELSTDGDKAELTLIPNTHGPIVEQDLLELLALPGFCKLKPLKESINKAIVQVNRLCGQDDGQSALLFTIAQRQDASISFEISDDKMQVSMTLTAAYGGQDITLKDILQNLKIQQVKLGLSKAKIDLSLAQFASLQPGEQCCNIIAQGRAAIHGKAAKLERKVMLARERLLQPQENSDGSVDMRNLGAVIMVKPGNTLILKHPATTGVNGYNVAGDKLLAKPGKDLKLVAGDGTKFSDNNPHLLIADVAGQPVETKQGMQVDDLLQIKNVNVGYGHVDFKGSVLITGDVGEGMQVKSSGDITVMGFVDSATLDAQGDITVSKGVIGRQLKDNTLSTTLKAQGQISAQFVQYSNLEASGNILVTKQLLHSHAKTKQQLIVCDASGRRGDLVGGKVEVDKGLKVVAIGATAGTKTEIFCAMHIREFKQDIIQLQDSIKSMTVAIANIDGQLGNLPPKAQWQDDEIMVEQVTVMLEEKRRIVSAKQQEQAEFESIQQEVTNYYKNYRVDALKHVFTNIEIHIGKAFNRTQRDHGPCSITNINQEIDFDYSAKK
ncbi:FapA family protein [Shewanella abyssi]|uniref:DUF342 domain-containing protein n=1 Tax=Shewanella abyssi TaxID=311789 RepID=UPI00200DF821|nr:FapA family protein [Shewanella abyssi]MCL1050280.1 FapA family protein [Shewanella abyssi]